MQIYLIKDYFRVDGITGQPVEKEFAADFVRHDSTISMQSAKNQYISFQVIFDTQGEQIDKMSIDFSDLTGTSTISSNGYEVFIEWFHKINGNYIPDLLVPLGETNLEFKVPLHDGYLKEQKVGALWVDLFIPEDTQPGEYTGIISVVANGIEKQFQINVQVHNVTVPAKTLITADLNNYADSISSYFPSLRNNKNRYRDGSFAEMEKKFVRMARDHRALFHNMGYKHSGFIYDSFAPELEGEGKNIRVKSWDLFDKHFGPYLDGTAFKGSKCGDHPIEFLYMPFHLGWPASYTKWGEKGYVTEYRRIIEEFKRHFEEKGWTNTYLEIILNHKKDYRFFPYTVDEIWYEHDVEGFDQFLDVIGDSLEGSDVKLLIRNDSSNNYGNHYEQYADRCKMWVANPFLRWFPESIPVMKKNKCILWLYGYGAMQPMDNTLLGLFNFPILCYMLGIDGFCSWLTTGFGNDYLNTPREKGSVAAFYPGVEFGYDGPLPTLRLKALRNHMQVGNLLKTTEGMDSEGLRLKIQAQRIINGYYGYKDNSCWWTEKPPFVDEPPRTWDFGPGGEVDKYVKKADYIGKSPVIIEKINNDLLRLLDRK